MLMQSIFPPMLFLSGSFWNPFSNENWHSTFLQYFLWRTSREGRERKDDSTGSDTVRKSLLLSAYAEVVSGFVCFIKNVIEQQGGGQMTSICSDVIWSCSSCAFLVGSAERYGLMQLYSQFPCDIIVQNQELWTLLTLWGLGYWWIPLALKPYPCF